MRKLSIILLVIMIISLIPTNIAMASSTIQSSLIKGHTGTLEFDDIYYKVAARLYKDYINGVEKSVIGIKGVDFENVDPTTGVNKINTLLSGIDGLTAEVKVKKVGDITKITATYDRINEYKNTPEVDAELDRLIKEASKFNTIREKLGYINDAIVKISKYDDKKENSVTYSAQGALINHLANCEGYTNIVYEICKKLGIKETNFGGYIHASNLLYIDGQWYLWDLTWNVCNTNRYGEEIAQFVYRTDSGIEWVYGLAERQYFLVPLTDERIEIYMKNAKTTEYNIGKYEAMLEIRHPDMCSLDFSLGDLEVDVSDIPDDDNNTSSGNINIPIPSEQPDFITDTTVEPETDYETYSIDSEGNVTVIKVVKSKVQAKPTTSTVLVNGKKIAFEAYNINGNNYFKLRDIAMAVTGTAKQFEVGWDGKNNAISLTTGKSYTSNGTELKASANPSNKEATKTTSKVYLNGRILNLTAYNINGSNYFMLRDIGKAINFNVTWDGPNNSILVDTTSKYIG